MFRTWAALIASILVAPAPAEGQQARYRDECTDRIQQSAGGPARAGALAKLVECGPAAAPALGGEFRAVAVRSDPVRLAELWQALVLVRDSTVLRAALAVAGDPAASSEARIAGLLVALTQQDSLVGLRPAVSIASILADSLESRCPLTIDRTRPRHRWMTPLPPATPWLVATAADAIAGSPGSGGLRIFARCVRMAIDDAIIARPGVFAGVVRDTAGRPVPDADIVGLSSRMTARTSRTGAFLLGDLGPGPEVFLVRSIGFAPQRFPVTLISGDTVSVDVVLGTSPQQLSELTVTALGREYKGKMARFAQRMVRFAAAASSFIGPEEIEQWGRFDLANVFRRAGLRVSNSEISCPVNGSIERSFDIHVYLDDVLVNIGPTFDISTFPSYWIQAIEVYRRVAEAPIEFQNHGAGCVVLILTKA